jgi:hypothetical protein
VIQTVWGVGYKIEGWFKEVHTDSINL